MYTDSPVVTSDPIVDNVPVDAVALRETPMVESLPVVAPMEETIKHGTEMGEMITHVPPIVTTVGSPPAALLNHEVSEQYRTRWNEIQGKFVDEPRVAVQQADSLVSDVIDQITQMFANEHGSLETQWNQGDDVSTEDLRMALQHYRSFFNRLVV
jgi:hypothetical protein